MLNDFASPSVWPVAKISCSTAFHTFLSFGNLTSIRLILNSSLQDAFNRSHKYSDRKTFVPLKQNAHKVFMEGQEAKLSTYAINIAKMFYVLLAKEFRQLTYKYAVAFESLPVPSAWEREQAATRDWYYAFMSGHRELTVKSPKGMSVTRAVPFNKVTVNAFFEAHTDAMEKNHFTQDGMYNLDETSLMKPVTVVCEKEQPIASEISCEQGATMTFVGIISAARHYVPPPVFYNPQKILE